MKKVFLAIVLTALLSAPFLSMASSDSDAASYEVENALIPDIYKVDVDSNDVNFSYGYSGGLGWVRIYIFVEGSQNEKNFLSAIENRQTPSQEQDAGSPGSKVMYVMSAGFDPVVYLNDQEIKIENKIYSSETTYHMISGLTVNITVDDSDYYFRFDSINSEFNTIKSGEPMKMSRAGDYRLYSGSWEVVFVSYTIEYNDDNVRNHTSLALVCIALGALGIVSLIWFGRKEKLF